LQLFHVSMGRAYITGMVGLLVMTTGCPGGPPPSMDAGEVDADTPSDADAAPTTEGLTFRFLANPVLPNEADGAFEVVITQARYRLAEVRAIGDAAPGDERTSRQEFEIRFEDGAIDLPFPLAPQGIYSILLADVDRYEVKGHLQKAGEEVDFEIVDDESDLELQVDLEGLELGEELVICVIEMDPRAITRVVDWGPLEPDDEDEIEIDKDFPGIDALREVADDFVKR
jgi:hypothetical protein